VIYWEYYVKVVNMYFSFALTVSEETATSFYSENSGTFYQNTCHIFTEVYLAALTQTRFNLQGTFLSLSPAKFYAVLGSLAVTLIGAISFC
jgi:hypothetical protein